MKARVLKEWITTLIGLAIILCSVASVFVQDKVTWYDALPAASFGFTLFFLKDRHLTNVFNRNKPKPDATLYQGENSNEPLC